MPARIGLARTTALRATRTSESIEKKAASLSFGQRRRCTEFLTKNRMNYFELINQLDTSILNYKYVTTT